MKRIMLVFLLIAGMLAAIACSSDDDKGTNPTNTDPWVGTWLSADANVAPILVALFKYDSVRVQFKDDQTVVTESHIKGGAWATLNGTYTVTKSQTGVIHSISIVYPAFEQKGIIQVTDGNPATMQLEVVQTNPDIGATPRTPDSGFGSDATLGTSNIQKYVKID